MLKHRTQPKKVLFINEEGMKRTIVIPPPDKKSRQQCDEVNLLILKCLSHKLPKGYYEKEEKRIKRLYY